MGKTPKPGRGPAKQTALNLLRQDAPGLYSDGGGLYLQVAPAQPADDGTPRVTKSWVFRYKVNGKLREMGLGALHTIPLAKAREKAGECRQLRLAGKDPIEERKAQRLAEQLEAAKARTFRQCGESYIAAHKSSWKNAKHAAQWTSTLETYVYPTIGHLSVADVDTGLVHRVLEPIWEVIPETARRVRGRIESILDYAAALKYRDNYNPARWKGQLEKLFPKRSRRNVRHHPALPYAEAPEFMAAVKERQGMGCEALQFTILTAARTNETILCQWPEFDLTKALWIVPADRMKAEREHRVPLSKPVLAILKKRHNLTGGQGFVFPGRKRERPISNMTMEKVLRDMGREDITVHGFRSTFRDWVEEETSYPGSVAEAALAHIVGDDTEAAYRRGDLFEKRRKLMDAWAKFCATPAKGANVIPIKRSARAAE
jgi:integrase